MTILERKEMEVLEYTGLPRIPDAYAEGGPVWVKAIARILTNTNSESYAVVYNDAGSVPRIVKTFDASGVSRVLNIYPYEYLGALTLPQFKNVQEAREFVVRHYGADPETVKAMKKEQLLKAVLRYALRRQIAAGADRERMQKDNNNTDTDNE